MSRHRPARRPTGRGSNVIGRGRDAHSALTDASVSRRHFVIEWDVGKPR
ncbi:FHA domain-containing protein [Actinomycetospora sp. NBRC 106375]